MLGNSSCFCCRLLSFFLFIYQNQLFQKNLSVHCNTIRVSNGFDSDQDRRSFGPDLCPNCLQSSKSPQARKVHFHVAILLESIYFYCKFLIALRYNDQELFTLRCGRTRHIFCVWNKSPVGCS